MAPGRQGACNRLRVSRRESGPHLALRSLSNLPGRALSVPFQKPCYGGLTTGSFWSTNSMCSRVTGSTARAVGGAGARTTCDALHGLRNHRHDHNHA
jgi:hypothetical protein